MDAFFLGFVPALVTPVAVTETLLVLGLQSFGQSCSLTSTPQSKEQK